jgi:arsenate reductase (thioredoxin)
VMTCSDADGNFPLISGASFRAPLTYDDPKEADGTPEETARYDERCRQIAAEMMYLFSLLGK